MAKQVGDIKIIGTIDDICYYRLQGEYCALQKSSLTGDRFWTAPVFAGSRRSCCMLGRASSLASRLYRTLPKGRKGRAVFQHITGRIKLLLKAGWDEAQIEAWFREVYFPEERKPAAKNRTPRKHK